MTQPAVPVPPTLGLAPREAFGRAVAELAACDWRVLMLDGEVGNSTRADIVSDACPAQYLPMGIAEQNMMGVAAGLAATGFVPFAATFAVFAAERALDQIRVLIAQPGLPVKIAAGYSGLLTGMAGKTHQSVEDVAIMRAMPGMVVLDPTDDVETRAAVRAAVELPGPVYLRVYREPTLRVFDDSYRFELGAAWLLRDGHDVGLISTGPETGRVLQAAELLAARGVEARVIHVPTIKPLDTEAVLALAEATGFIVTVEEHSIVGGLGGAVAELLGERRPTPMRRVGLRDVWGESAPNEALLDKYGLTPRRVAEQVLAALEVGRPRDSDQGSNL